MKIKTFQFALSNYAGNHLHSQFRSPSDRIDVDKRHPYDTEKQIDKRVNRWIEKRNAIVRDLKTTTYTIDRHNNGYDDTVIMVYTIMYDLPAGAEDGKDAQ